MMRLKWLVLALAMAGVPVYGEVSSPARERVLADVATLIAERYVDPEKGAIVAQAVRDDIARDHLRAATDDADFARRVTERLRTVSGDGHFALEPRPVTSAAEEAEPVLMERWYGVGVNHGFQAVQRLDDGIGYLDLRVFAPLEKGGDLAAAAMSMLAGSPALIVDLRRNGGGMDEMVLFLAAYLLDGSHEMSGIYDRPSGRTTRSFTPSWVPGRRFGGEKPVFILVSRRTFSAAEQFAYDLQAMGRATIIGERTGGGAHPTAIHPVGDGFLLTVPEGRSINPVTRGDWEGTGVVPNIPSSADEALGTALRLARNEIAGKSGAERPPADR